MPETLAPTGKLDLAAVSKFHKDLLAAADQDIILDLGEVTQMGALCLQACIAAAQLAQAGEHSFELHNVPDTVAENIKSMGFDAQNLLGSLA